MKALVIALVGLLLVSTSSLMAVTAGQQDTFTDGTVQGWSEGVISPNPPTNVATGGPAGTGDRYLRNVSSGGAGAGSRMTMFNDAQWTGDYVAAGIVRIEADMANFGSTTLQMRIGLRSGADGFVSTTALTLPAGSGWQHLSFQIDVDSMSQVSGTNPLSVALATVQEVRILSGTTLSLNGDPIVATLGVDNITAPIVGDVDGDGHVDVVDLLYLADTWAKSLGDAGFNPQCDFNHDDSIDVVDLLMLAANWGT